MDLVSRELAPVNITEQTQSEPAAGAFVPSPLAEVAAGTAIEKAVRSRAANRQVSRPGQRSALRRRKARRSTRRRLFPGGVVVGSLAGVNDSGQPLVRHALDPSGRVTLARTTVPIRPAHIDREVVITFESGDVARPIVIGVLERPDDQNATEPRVTMPKVSRPIAQAALDGEELVLSAQNKIILRCGEASITLTRSGKVLIRGAYLLSRSSGVNRIKGGAVQIN
jgi:hypothetical protein